MSDGRAHHAPMICWGFHKLEIHCDTFMSDSPALEPIVVDVMYHRSMWCALQNAYCTKILFMSCAQAASRSQAAATDLTNTVKSQYLNRSLSAF